MNDFHVTLPVIQAFLLAHTLYIHALSHLCILVNYDRHVKSDRKHHVPCNLLPAFVSLLIGCTQWVQVQAARIPAIARIGSERSWSKTIGSFPTGKRCQQTSKGDFAGVSSKSYMRGYRGIYRDVSLLHKLMIRSCDSLVKMIIVKIRFRQSTDNACRAKRACRGGKPFFCALLHITPRVLPPPPPPGSPRRTAQ